MNTVASVLAGIVAARLNCIKDGDTYMHLREWIGKHQARGDAIARECLPGGSCIDHGTRIDWERSKPDCLVLCTPCHHMNAAGYYDGWTDHLVSVRPSLAHGLALSISGKDRSGIKDYLADTFYSALREECEL